MCRQPQWRQLIKQCVMLREKSPLQEKVVFFLMPDGHFHIDRYPQGSHDLHRCSSTKWLARCSGISKAVGERREGEARVSALEKEEKAQGQLYLGETWGQLASEEEGTEAGPRLRGPLCHKCSRPLIYTSG